MLAAKYLFTLISHLIKSITLNNMPFIFVKPISQEA